jgi:hypothetical protein
MRPKCAPSASSNGNRPAKAIHRNTKINVKLAAAAVRATSSTRSCCAVMYAVAMVARAQIMLGDMREMSVRRVLVYCSDFRCSHSVAISADRLVFR